MNAQVNIKAREDAEQMIALCGEQPPRFWEVLANIAAEKFDRRLMLAPKAVADGKRRNE